MCIRDRCLACDLYKLYPDINDDLVKSRYDLLVETEFRINQNDLALLWIQNNLSHDSFLNMLAKFHEYKQREAEDETDDYRRNWNMHDWIVLYPKQS